MKVAIVGASLGGLAAANALHKLGATVKVFEKFPAEFSQRGAVLGFVDVGMWEELLGKRMMRRGRRAVRAQGAFYYGDLWRFLYSGLPEGTVAFGRPVAGLGDDVYRPTIDGETYDLAILADGGWSKLRRYVTDTQPEYAGYVCWRGKIDANDYGSFNDFGIVKNGFFDTIVLQMSKDDGTDVLMGGVFVATPAAEVVRPSDGASRHVDEDAEAHAGCGAGLPEWFLPFYRQQFGDHAGGALVRLFEAFASRGELTPQPQYDYAADKVSNGRVVLVGDAAHMASPRTAAGAHTAVLDALALHEAFLAGGTVDEKLAAYSCDAVRRARELYARSLDVRRQFLPRGGLTTVQSPSTLVAVQAQ